jgi:DNA-binding response OmpR family regulator
MSKRILVVDDEPDTLELIEFNLTQAGCEVVTAPDGEEALRKVRAQAPALIVLDVMLPGMSGMDICGLLKRNPATALIPIVMLTAKAAEIDRVLGLELGADDYLTKPFSPRELVLRVKGLLRRTAENPAIQAEQLHLGDLVVDLPRHEVLVTGERVLLTAKEFRLLVTLATRRGRVQTREQLLRDVWDCNTLIDTRTVDTHMRRLREKLGKAARNLETLRGVGYRFSG